MPKTGDRNSEFGVFKSECCGSEIVIGPGVAFPVCPEHPGPTGWVNVGLDADSPIDQQRIA